MATLELSIRNFIDFIELGEEASVSAPTRAPLVRLLAAGDGLLAGPHPIAVDVPSDADVADLAPFLGQLAEVTLNVPRFGDGRPYSQARRLREQFGFTGVIRARGDVLADQVRFMQRCGIDVVELAPHVSLETAKAALEAFSADYQPTAATQSSIIDRRRAHRAA